VTRRVLLLVLALAVLVGCTSRQQPISTTTTLSTLGQPKPTITPGVVATTSRADVCTAGWASKHRRSLTAAQKAAVLKAYGYPASQKVAEWDHLLPLELGGGNGAKNIWPQLNDRDQQRKDGLENRLHAAVCRTKDPLPLTVAQDEIIHFWLHW
jgi:hypothetical protein